MATGNENPMTDSNRRSITDDLAVVRVYLDDYVSVDDGHAEALAALDRIERERQSWVDECAVLNTRLVNAEGRAYRYKDRLAEAERRCCLPRTCFVSRDQEDR